MKLTTILEGVVSMNDVSALERLLHFSVHVPCLKVPSRCSRNGSLATLFNKQLRKEKDLSATIKTSRRGKGRGKVIDPL